MDQEGFEIKIVKMLFVTAVSFQSNGMTILSVWGTWMKVNEEQKRVAFAYRTYSGLKRDK